MRTVFVTCLLVLTVGLTYFLALALAVMHR